MDILLLLLLLFFSFIFSGSETAFFSKDEIDLSRIYSKQKIFKKLFALIYNARTSFLITLLFLNTFVNVLFVTLIGKVYNSFPGTVLSDSIVRMIITTLILLMIGEITPKMIAVYKTSVFFKLMIIPELFFFIIKPFADIISFIPERMGHSKTVLEEKELKEFLSIIKDMGYEIHEEARLIEQYIELKNTNINALMIDKDDIVYIDYNESVLEVMSKFEKYRFSRMPVIKNNVENIVGMLYFKDLLYLNEDSSIKSIIRDTYFISNKASVFNVLNKLLKNRIHLAIVKSDNGRIIGAITLNNILEKLLGPLPDEIGSV